MAEVTTSRQVWIAQLASELGGSVSLRMVGEGRSDDPKKVSTDDVTQQALQTAIDAHVADWATHDAQVAAAQADADAEQAARQARTADLSGAIATLRTWADDAASTNVTNGNNNAVTQSMVNRLGTFFDRFADLLENQGYGG